MSSDENLREGLRSGLVVYEYISSGKRLQTRMDRKIE